MFVNFNKRLLHLGDMQKSILFMAFDTVDEDMFFKNNILRKVDKTHYLVYLRYNILWGYFKETVYLIGIQKKKSENKLNVGYSCNLKTLKCYIIGKIYILYDS